VEYAPTMYRLKLAEEILKYGDDIPIKEDTIGKH